MTKLERAEGLLFDADVLLEEIGLDSECNIRRDLISALEGVRFIRAEAEIDEG